MENWVYLLNGEWWATHVGCDLCPIGPFPSKKEAEQFQEIEFADLTASLPEDEQFLPSDCVWWGGTRIKDGQRYGFARHFSGGISSKDRWILLSRST